MIVPEARLSYRKVGEIDADSSTNRIRSPADLAAAARLVIGDDDREHFLVFPVDSRHRILARPYVASIGTLNASLVHPREVFRFAIAAGCHAIAVAHNHPSDDRTPSREDFETTRRLAAAGEVIGIRVLDHVVVTETSFYSFREEGQLDRVR